MTTQETRAPGAPAENTAGAGGVPYALTRVGVVMTPEPGNLLEAEGVLNPASARAPDGRIHLLPRMVSKGNVSRIGSAALIIQDGIPVGVERLGVVLAPDQAWERGTGNAGVEDPRVTWVPSLRVYVMTYVAYGPLGPRAAMAVSEDLQWWRRLGPVQFGYQPDLNTDLNLFTNKDVVFFPEPVPDPAGRPAYAMLHRPTWDLSWLRPGEVGHLPAGVGDPRPGMWISYIPVDEARADIRALTRPSDHHLLALPQFPYEQLKVGAGPPPIRVDEGWLLIHHGVSGHIPAFGDPTPQRVEYSAGAMLLSADDPSQVIARTPAPILAPETEEERHGVVANVVFPTASEVIDGQRFVFYGMADAKIGVARLDRVGVLPAG